MPVMNLLLFASHRHNRYALFFHSLALIDCLRKDDLEEVRRDRYMKQVDINQHYIRKCVNYDLSNRPPTLILYQVAVAKSRQ